MVRNKRSNTDNFVTLKILGCHAQCPGAFSSQAEALGDSENATVT
jgi:hypothetical protein